MNLVQVRDLLDAEPAAGDQALDCDVKMACGADLMSDVLAFTKSGSLLLTGLTNSQVIRTAEVAEIRAICFVRGKRPQPETLELARERGIPLLCTHLPMYEACGRLHRGGLPGCSEVAEE
ncbi:MAG: DRTGG domain-containing protein [Planctomycetia bacterium]|nr:DRTGG domain-containing protein [Planctomycetia bacterium]